MTNISVNDETIEIMKEHINKLFNETIQSGVFVESLAYRVNAVSAVAIKERMARSEERVAKLIISKSYSMGCHKLVLVDQSLTAFEQEVSADTTANTEWKEVDLPKETLDSLRAAAVAEGFNEGDTAYLTTDIQIQKHIERLQALAADQDGYIIGATEE